MEESLGWAGPETLPPLARSPSRPPSSFPSFAFYEPVVSITVSVYRPMDRAWATELTHILSEPVKSLTELNPDAPAGSGQQPQGHKPSVPVAWNNCRALGTCVTPSMPLRPAPSAAASNREQRGRRSF